MELFKRRPMALMCFLSIIIIVIVLKFNDILRTIFCFVLVFLGIFALLCSLYFAKKNSVKLKKLIVFIGFIFLSLLLICSANRFTSKNEQVYKLNKCEVNVSGTVTDVRLKSSTSSEFNVNIESINGEETNINLVLEIAGHSSLRIGNSFLATGIIEALSDNEDAYIKADGYNGKLICESESDVRINGIQINNQENFFDRLNSSFQSTIISYTDEDTGSLVGALLLGNRYKLNAEILRDFGRCGLSHMLALSGLHMTIIIGFFDMIMQNILVDKRFRCVILIFLSVSYLAMTGFSPSASRSVIMLCIVYLAYLLNNDSDSVTSLFIALVIIILLTPYSVYDIGLWMSFFATLGILAVSEILSKLQYKIKKKPLPIRVLINVTVSVIVTLAAVFSTCIFSWLFFGEISLVSPLTNLIFSPLMTIIISVGLLLIVFSPVPTIAGAIGELLVFLTSIFTEGVSKVSDLRGITISLKYDFVPFIIIPFTISLLVILAIKLKHKWLIAFPPLLAIIAFSISLSAYNSANKDNFEVIYMKEKTSEMLIITSIYETSVCDISTGGYNNFLNAFETCYDIDYLTEIDNVFITHYHNYHSGSLSKICNKYLVRNVYLPIAETDVETQIQAEIIEALEHTKSNVIIYKRGVKIKDINGNVISVSTNRYVDRSTHPTFAVSVSSDTKTLVYSTSAMLEADANIIPSSTDILIFGSHGPRVKPFERSSFEDSGLSTVPQTIVFSSPYEMLDDKDIISYIHYLYQIGHTVIIDGKEYYIFKL